MIYFLVGVLLVFSSVYTLAHLYKKKEELHGEIRVNGIRYTAYNVAILMAVEAILDISVAFALVVLGLGVESLMDYVKTIMLFAATIRSVGFILDNIGAMKR